MPKVIGLMVVSFRHELYHLVHILSNPIHIHILQIKISYIWNVKI